MKKDQLDEEFLNSIRDELEETVAGLDGETRSKLNRIRHNAISRVGRSHINNRLAYIGGALAACLVMALVMFYPASMDQDLDKNMNTVQADLIDDLELLSTNDDLDFLEDLDFYEWLEEYEPQV